MVVDPMIIDPRSAYFQLTGSRPGAPSGLTRGAVGRPDVWPSLSSIKPTLLKSPFFQAFHPTQLDSYIQHGFILLNPSDPTDLRATLAFPRWAEALIFTKGYPLGEVWDRLEFGGEKVGKGGKEVRWVFPGIGQLSGPDSDHQRISHFLSDPPPPTSDVPLALKPTKSSNVIVEGAGHLVVQERPVEMGEVLTDFLVDLFGERDASKGREAKL
ncbi:hypothetical protein BDY24DRAFT_384080 [Mrakia frigida]|uniref:uncharacterized protein n=1 Tax=Mrakia frigida TaxID=29902 RepID=UPI003FCBF0DD